MTSLGGDTERPRAERAGDVRDNGLGSIEEEGEAAAVDLVQLSAWEGGLRSAARGGVAAAELRSTFGV